MQKIIGVTDLQRQFKTVLDEVADQHVPYVLIRGSQPRAVIDTSILVRALLKPLGTVAAEGRADVLAKGDEDLLVLHPFQGIPIVQPAAFLAMLE